MTAPSPQAPRAARPGQAAMHGPRAALADRAGNATVQFALILPAFVMLLFGVFEIGRVLWLQNALHYAVEQAARCAALGSTSCSAANIGAYASAVSGASIPASAFQLSNPSCGDQVDGTYTTTLMIPYYPVAWTLTAKSCFPS